MQIEPMKGLEDVLLIRPDLHEDDRGYFYEVFNEKEFNEKTGNKYDFHALQENESKSSKYVFRGLHFQKPPYEQAKLVRVLKGSVIDYAVDIRKDSPTFGKWTCAKLSEENKLQFFIPRGFAHGFLVTSKEAVFEYKCDNYYNKESEGGIKWNDENILGGFKEWVEHHFWENLGPDAVQPETGKWIDLIILSEKDKNRETTLKDL
jgi:dTDP-4-dehydrorhamnose 3,5-epimerase